MTANRINFRAYIKPYNKIYRVYDLMENGDIVECIDDKGNFVDDNGNFVGDGFYKNDFVLMQSTGLTDKNGKEIFESDVVVDINDKTKYKVFYREIGACFSLEFLDSEDFACVDFGEIQYEGIERHLEVIGNIYENPELLTK